MTAVPPGSQPKQARKQRNMRLGASPSVRRKPTSVNSGMAGKKGWFVSWFIAIETAIEGISSARK